MKRAAVFLLAFAFVAVMLAGQVNANSIDEDGFEALVTIDNGQPVNIPLLPIDEKRVGFSLVDPIQAPEFIINELEILINFDPFINIAISLIDLENPTSFIFEVDSKLDPALGPTVQSTLSLGGTDTIDQIAQSTIEGDKVNDITSNGSLTSTVNCIDFGDKNSECNSFDLSLSFTGEGGSAAYSFTANHTIEPASAAPEPATMSLLGLGMIGLVWLGRKKLS